MNEKQKKEVLKALTDISNKFENYIVNTCPQNDCREMALIRLHEAWMWARSSIYRNENEI